MYCSEEGFFLSVNTYSVPATCQALYLDWKYQAEQHDPCFVNYVLHLHAKPQTDMDQKNTDDLMGSPTPFTPV